MTSAPIAPTAPSPSPCSPTPPPWTTYRIGRGETSVLTHEPYKSVLLPLWRFRTPSIARTSSASLYSAFLAYEAENDFVGMDMCRKFLQMGMTRAKRYANRRGGRKYAKVEGKEGNDKEEGGKGKGEVLPIEEGDWEGRKEKEEASQVFREVWDRARVYGPYLEMKGEFLRRQREWDKERKKREEEDGVSRKTQKRKREKEDDG